MIPLGRQGCFRLSRNPVGLSVIKMIKSFAMYRCSVELSVRYDELSQSEREHASLIDEYTRLILRQTGSICVLI